VDSEKTEASQQSNTNQHQYADVEALDIVWRWLVKWD
jgi:hypothetical protein